MINKTTTVLALAIAINATVSYAMNKTQPSDDKPAHHIIKKVNVTTSSTTIKPVKVPCKIWIATPKSAVSEEEKNAYYQTRKEEVHNKLMRVLEAYEKAQENPVIGNHFITIKPTELFFVPDANRFTIRHSWKTHKITDTVTALLETRMECRFEQGKLIPKIPMLHITHKATNAKESIGMNELFKMFPDKNILNLNPDDSHGHAKRLMALGLEQGIGLAQGKNPADLPDVDALTHDLHLADIIKMVAHYLSTKNVHSKG